MNTQMTQMTLDTSDFTLVENSRCSTTYKYKGCLVELYMICSGEPCIWLHDDNYNPYNVMSERFPIVPKYQYENWLKGESRYRHQSPTDATPDITPELLTGGWQTFITEVQALKIKNDIGKVRLAQLPQHYFVSRRLYDKENRTYVRLHFDLFRPSLPVVCADDETIKLASPWWQKTKQIFDSMPDVICWHDLTDDQFNVILEHFKTVTPKDLKA